MELNEQELDEHVFDLLSPDERPSWLDFALADPLPEYSGMETGSRRRVPKNDIRRFIPKMFCNVINSGRFRQTQIFMESFVAPNCQLVAFYDVPTYFHFPAQVNAHGQIQIGHYMLGNQLMFPDLVVNMSDTNIMLLPDGSKISMEVEFHLTKTAHIPLELWVPSLDLIESLYKVEAGWQLTYILRHQHLYRSPTRAIIPTSSSEDVTETPVHPSVAVSNDSQDAAERQSFPSLALDRPASSTGTTSPPGTCTPVTTVPTGAPTAATPATGVFCLPERFAAAMYQAAAPVYQPTPMLLRGQVVFLLDMHNHITSIDVRLAAVF